MARFVIRYLCDSGVKRVLADFYGRDSIANYEARLYIKENTSDFDLEVFAIERLPKCQEKSKLPGCAKEIPVSHKLLAVLRWFAIRLRQKLK